ncbi:MAG: DUF5666 domain-containing protein [Chromatiales bacterium]|jgi:hypothetical protein
MALQKWISLLLCVFLLLGAVQVFANPCALPSSRAGGAGEGIGGTGLHPGPVLFPDEGLGGTGRSGFSEGIGGSGHSEGIGGTGMPRLSEHDRLLVHGVVTGFASVCVNGFEVHYDDTTRVLLNGTPARLQELRVGQIVSIQSSVMRGELVAEQLDIRHEVIGPVREISADGRVIEIAGQTVHLNSRLPGGASAQLHRDLPVRVSGLRNQRNEIVATRLELAPADTPVMVTGPVSRRDSSSFNIAGLQLPVPAGGLPDSAEVRLSIGQTGAEPQALQLEALPASRDLPFASIQGIVEQADSHSIKLAGWSEMPLADVPARQPDRIRPGSLVRLNAVADDKGLAVGALQLLTAEDLFQRAGREDIAEPRENPDGRNHSVSGKHDRPAQDVAHGDAEDRSGTDHDTGHVSHEGDEAVEEPEYEGPEYETPELPEHEEPEYELPEMPEHEEPEVPEHEEVELPEYEPPEVPEFEIPEPPEYEPPEFELPEPPEYEEPEHEEFEHDEHEHEEHD